MVDFTTQDQGPVQGQVSVKAPIVDTGMVDALRTVGTTASTLFSLADDAVTKGKKTAATAGMGELGTTLNNLNEAQSQGKLNPRQRIHKRI